MNVRPIWLTLGLAVIAAITVGRIYRVGGPQRDLQAIKRDKSGILHEIGIRSADDLRLVESCPTTRLLMPEDRDRITRLLAILANAREFRPSRSPSYMGSAGVLLVTRSGKAIAVSIRSGEWLRSPKTGSMFVCDGAFRWARAVDRDPTLVNRGSHLNLPPLESIRVDQGAGKTICVGCRVIINNNRTTMSLGNVLTDMLSYADPREMRPLDWPIQKWGVDQVRYSRSPSVENPVIYLRFARPIKETLIYAQVTDRGADCLVVYPLRQVRVLAKEIAIYRATSKVNKDTHMMIALIPTDGGTWYTVGDPGKWGKRYYDWHFTGPHRLLGNTDAEWKDPVQSLYQKTADQLRKEH